MAYRNDSGLNFLKDCTDEELKSLYDILVYDPKDNSKWISETLSISDECKRYGTQYSKYWKRIAEELQLQGGNTIINIFRFGDGVLYKEIVEDVASSLKIPYSSGDGVEEIENTILAKIVEEMFENLSDIEIGTLMEEVYSPKEYRILLKKYNNNIPWGKIGLSLTREMLKKGGFGTYKLTVMAANYIWKKLFGKGLTFVGNKVITKTLGNLLAGPLALALNAWIIFDIAGPATRITTPAVLIVATLRKKLKYKEADKNKVENVKVNDFKNKVENAKVNDSKNKVENAKVNDSKNKVENAEVNDSKNKVENSKVNDSKNKVNDKKLPTYSFSYGAK